MRPASTLALMKTPTQLWSKGIPYTLAFTSSITSITYDTAEEQMSAEIEFIQSVFIDNSLNNDEFILTVQMADTPISLRIPPGQIGYYPVPVDNGVFRFNGYTLGAVNVVVAFFNIALPYFVWSAATNVVGSRPLIVTGTVTFAAGGAYTQGYNMGGILTAQNLPPSTILSTVIFQIMAPSINALSATNNISVTPFNALPNSAGTTLIDGSAVAIAAADLPKIAAAEVLLSGAGMGNNAATPGLVNASLGGLIATDAAGKLYIALTAAAAGVNVTSGTYNWRLQAKY